jgi:hypothetical protein
VFHFVDFWSQFGFVGVIIQEVFVEIVAKLFYYSEVFEVAVVVGV